MRALSWWYWLFTASALAGSLSGWTRGFAAAFALLTLQAVHLGLLDRGPRAFPMQVRIGYLGILLLGAWKPLAWLHAAQLAGLLILLSFDYCLLGRILSLMPWNRGGPLTIARLRATFLSPPVEGSILAELDRVAPSGPGSTSEAAVE